MKLSFKKWLENVHQGADAVKQHPELPRPGEDWPKGQTHAMPHQYGPGSDELPPTPKYGMRMKKDGKKKKKLNSTKR